jgi:CheY-like chemotaxis protein
MDESARVLAEKVETGANVPPAAFVEAVKDALDHLYDFSRLNNHRLASWLLPSELPRGVSHAQALRQHLLDAIEHVNPGGRLASSTRQKRAFRLLEMRYVEATSFRDVMRTLALSQAQYHREQRNAIGMVASYLWDTLASSPGDVPPAELRRVSILEEPRAQPGLPWTPTGGDAVAPQLIAPASADPVRLSALLTEVVGLVGHLARERGAQIRIDTVSDKLCSTDRTTLRSALIGALGYLLDGIQGGDVLLSAEESDALMRIEARRAGTNAEVPRAGTENDQIAVSRVLMRALGGDLEVARTEGGIVVSLTFPTRRAVLLVIDDNPDLVQLITRYVADQHYVVLSASTVEAGFGAAKAAHPDIILLDVMLPHRDGWEALQLLHHHPSTAEIPVVVCSVLAEDRLAVALGARAFIRKPVTRPALLHVLGECRAVHFPVEAAGRGEPASPARSG